MGKSEYQKLVDEKKAAKKDLYKTSYPGTDLKTPLLVIVGPEKEKDEESMLKLLEGLFVLPVKIIVISDNEPEDPGDHPSGHVTFVSTEDGRNQPKINDYLLAADMAIVLDDDHNRLLNILEKGTVVIGHEESPYLENYQPNDETGNSFTFSSNNPWDIFRATVRATETFHFPYDWGNIVRAIIKNA
jgi:hypothetical protein